MVQCNVHVELFSYKTFIRNTTDTYDRTTTTKNHRQQIFEETNASKMSNDAQRFINEWNFNEFLPAVVFLP